MFIIGVSKSKNPFKMTEIMTSEESSYNYYLKAVENGDETAKNYLAWYMLAGYGDANPEEAVKLLQERVNEHNSDAMWMLGICYEFGIGTEQNLEQAESLYRQSGSRIGNRLLKNGGGKERGNGVLGNGVLSVFPKYGYNAVSDVYFLKLVLPIAPWTRLDLSGNYTRKKGASIVSELLMTNTTLNELDMSCSLIGNSGAIMLSESLKKNNTLTRLILGCVDE